MGCVTDRSSATEELLIDCDELDQPARSKVDVAGYMPSFDLGRDVTSPMASLNRALQSTFELLD
jgi:hypothetical protein